MRRCPMCESDHASVIRVVERGGQRYRIVECQKCSFVFAGDVRGDTSDHELPPAPGFAPPYRRRHFQIRKLLKTLLPGPQKQLVVEIGCGHGALGRMLAADYDYVGFEPGGGRSDYARSLGLDVRSEYFVTGSLDRPAAAIVLDNVLEHLIDPLVVLDAATASLAPGGYLVVLTPNRYDVRQVIPAFRDRHFWIPDQHVNYFRPGDVRRLLTERGFETKPFGFKALGVADYKYAPRAILETFGIYPFGLNLFGRLSG